MYLLTRAVAKVIKEVVNKQFILLQVVFLSCDGVVFDNPLLCGAVSGQEIHIGIAPGLKRLRHLTSNLTLRAGGAC